VSKLLSDYGMVLMLLLLCIFFSALTFKKQAIEGEGAAGRMLEAIRKTCTATDPVLVVSSDMPESVRTVDIIMKRLKQASFSKAAAVKGTPRDVRSTLNSGETPAVIVRIGEAIKWRLWDALASESPEFRAVLLINPENYFWPDLLKTANLLAVVNRIVVIAIIAIGMTMVIITGGIDLSVGSLIALSAVISTIVMKKLGGAEAPAWAVAAGFLAGILSCGIVGVVGGTLVARLKIAPFITTLAFMMIARGLAYIISGGFSIDQVPAALPWLSQGRTLGIPHTVILLVLLYTAATLFMGHTRIARYIYAVGGNESAAHLSGVPVNRIIVFVYIVSALAAGLGGCLMASKLNTGTPTCGKMFELYVIAAVVVGGTSLSGGSGKILGTLIGAFIISVIQNGMNLLNIGSYTQTVVLGLIILGAVLLDKLRSSISWTFLSDKGEN
jgi:ribose transport system permease protein